MMAVKDFVWEGDKARWVPLGQGVVRFGEVLKVFRTQNFAGPVSIHFEYKTPSREALLEDMRAAIRSVKDALAEAGYA
jgi:sugar phosphate isomerase/epimerase